MFGKSKKKKQDKQKEDAKSKKSENTKKKGDEPVVDDESKVKRADQIKICIGFLLLAFVILMVVSFISYFFTWKSDQSLSNYGFFEAMFNSDIQVENKAGKIGALVANFFIRDTFGIASFAIVAMLVVISLRLLKIRKVRILPFMIKSTVIMLWFSLALASIFKDSLFMLGGKHGYFLFTSMRDMVGAIGAYSIIIVLALIIVIFCFENSILGIKRILEKIANFKVKDIKTKLSTEEDEMDKPAEPKDGEGGDVDSILPIEHTGEENTDEPTEPDESETPTVIDLYKSPDGKKKDDGEIDLEINPINVETPEEELADTEQPQDEESQPVDEEPTQEDEPNEDMSLEINKPQEEEIVDENDPDEWLKKVGPYDPRAELEDYKFPSLDLLKTYDNENAPIINQDEQRENANRIVTTLRNYGVEIDSIKATVGPTVTLYEVVPKAGVRISKIQSLESDIMLSLSAAGIRIIAPMPGKGTVGIEVPNEKPQMVSMHSVIASKRFQEEKKMRLPIAYGRTITNEIFMFDLAKTPHLLVAGATGTGKSVAINAIITSLLYKKHPAELKLVMVDPKMVEFAPYKPLIRHFLAAQPDTDPQQVVITDCDKVINTLNSLVVEMEERYKLLMDAGVRNLEEYNEKFINRRLNPQKVVPNTSMHHQFLPYIVIIIDEYGDFIMQAGKQVETPIARITQKARAVGMHMILATQRPSVNIVTGVIKANIPTRIALRTQSVIDSRTVLDAKGAEQLIGRGDSLYAGNASVTRIQCAFVDTPEVDAIVDHIEHQQHYIGPYELPEVKTEGGEDAGGGASLDPNSRDPLFEEAARLVCSTQQGSTSMLQRKFGIGYNRAGRIVDQLEAMGIVGPYEGSKARQVMYDETSLERYLETLREIK
ncbi:MAG: DNA translocase FtsK 4TM domain-containing protein [Bacteroidales bacterium]|nr:DNA translocase FtsK 4TM domain-containing protein [Bacteroidales bacterium]